MGYGREEHGLICICQRLVCFSLGAWAKGQKEKSVDSQEATAVLTVLANFVLV